MFEVLLVALLIGEAFLLRLQGVRMNRLSDRIDVLSEELDLLTEDD